MKIISTAARSLCLLLSVLFVATLVSFAQSTRGELTGTITYALGAVIPGATVLAVNQATGSRSQTVSSSSGDYRFSELPVGSYRVTVTAAGFSTTTDTGVQITINSVTALNVSLKVGAQNETVTVDASGLRVESESSDISGTISQKQIEDLPLSLASGVGGLRSPETFAFLVPGTTGPGSGGPTGLNANGVFFAKLSGRPELRSRGAAGRCQYHAQ